MLKPWPASTHLAWFSGWKWKRRKSLASSMFFEKFQIPTHQNPVVALRSLGPRGVLIWSITSAMGFGVPGTKILSFFADSKALMGLWMAMHLPALRHRLLLASSQASTSGSIASVYSRLTNSMASRVSGELIVTVSPSFATYDPP